MNDVSTTTVARYQIMRLACSRCDLDAVPEIPPSVTRDYLDGEWLHLCDANEPGRLLFSVEPEGLGTLGTLSSLYGMLQAGAFPRGFATEVVQQIQAPERNFDSALNKALLA